jgi:uncharacterized damage-inducible protein DinB
VPTLFRYNWQVRDEWFDWCENVPHEELVRRRTGGVGSFLKTLWHVVDAEYSWLRAVEGKPDISLPFDNYQTLGLVHSLSNECREEIRPFIEKWTSAMEAQRVQAAWLSGQTFTAGEVLRHVIAHEIHHLGQMSVWARQLGREPVSANLVDRELV